MIVLYDYEGKSKEERQRPIFTSVKELSDEVLIKILQVKLGITSEEATEMVSKGKRDNDRNWWSEDRRYSVEITNA